MADKISAFSFLSMSSSLFDSALFNVSKNSSIAAVASADKFLIIDSC
jgi:hypothetical protein